MNLAEIEFDINKIEDYLNTNFKRDSEISMRVSEYLETLKNEYGLVESPIPSSKHSDKITLNIKLNKEGYPFFNIQMFSDNKISELKKVIESHYKFNIAVDRLILKNESKISLFNDESLETCGINNNDEILVDCKSMSPRVTAETEYRCPKGLLRIAHSKTFPMNRYDLIVLALHSFMLDDSFVCLDELPNSVPGFAPSLRGP